MKQESINFKGEFGVELESLRVSKEGFLSTAKHPFDDKRVMKDFAECQMELITSVYNNIDDLYEEIKSIYENVNHVLRNMATGREYIWPFSNPTIIRPGEEIPVAHFNNKDIYREKYREYLANKYGRKKMLYSGVHFNFSFFNDSGNKEQKNERYIKLAAGLVKLSWLIVLLMGASPVYDISLISDSESGRTMFGNDFTRRCGEHGYWNDFVPILDYTDIESYANSIIKYVNSGDICSESELYYPVRVKPHGEYSMKHLIENGAGYIEYRLIDLNPLTPYGIDKRDMMFLHMLCIYIDENTLCESSFSREEQMEAISKIKLAAKVDGDIYIKEAVYIVEKIKYYFIDVVSDEYINALDYQLDKLYNPCNRYSNIIRERYGEDFIGEGMKTAMEYSDMINNGRI